jgi:hypothetical protein
MTNHHLFLTKQETLSVQSAIRIRKRQFQRRPSPSAGPTCQGESTRFRHQVKSMAERIRQPEHLIATTRTNE